MSPKRIPVSARLIEEYTPMSVNGAQPTPESSSNAASISNIQRYQLYNWYELMPELRGIVTTLISDVFGEGYVVDGSTAKQKKAMRFLRKNHFNLKMKAILRDYFISGDGYLGKSAITEQQVFDFVDKAYQKTMNKSANSMAKMEVVDLAKKIKPDLYSPTVLFPLPARTMKINYDEHGQIHGYVQSPITHTVTSTTNTNDTSVHPTQPTSGVSVEYAPEEVIHFALDPVGDSIYGTSPLYTCLRDVAALFYAKNYGGVFFQNDATPSYIYLLKNETPNSANYKNFVEQLKRHKRNPHKSIVITGEVDVKAVSPNNKDLEFGMFMDKYLQRILMGWGVTARFSHLFTGRLELPANLESYYKLINSIQGDLEEQLNDELFEHFGVEFSFKRVYKRDESREADIVTKLVGRPVLTPTEGREYLGYKPLPESELLEVIQPTPKKERKDDVQSADARTDQNAETPTGPYRPKDEVK